MVDLIKDFRDADAARGLSDEIHRLIGSRQFLRWQDLGEEMRFRWIVDRPLGYGIKEFRN